MILLERTTPNKLEVCEALRRRAIFADNSYQILTDLMLKTSIGYEGECYADKYWEDLRLEMPHYLFHNFETTHRKGYHHQMDSIFLCQNFVLVVELKYIAGEIHYDEKAHQLWRLHNGRKLALGDPFAQVSRHEMWMTQFLWDINVDLPIITAVIITSKSAFLGKMPERFHVFKLEGLGLKLKDWLHRYPTMLTTVQMRDVANQLLRQHQPRMWDWRKRFGDLQFRKGIVCECGNTLIYHRGKYSCSCGYADRHAHLLALHDYRLLVGEWISNHEFRKLVGIESAHAANKILKRLRLEECGSTKLRRYKIPESIYK